MSNIGFCVAAMPSAEEIAEVDAVKAQIRQENLDLELNRKSRYRGGGQWALNESDNDHERKRLKMLDESRFLHAPALDAPVSSGDCPTCGKPFGKRRRCFVCKPSHPKLGKAHIADADVRSPVFRPKEIHVAIERQNGRHIEPEPVAPQADVITELDAIRAVYETLRDLPEPSLTRVRRYLDEVLWKEVTA